MSSPLVLILAVALAYLAAHVAFDWLAKRYLLVSGAEYLLLGILLGPHVARVLSTEVVAGFAPLTTFALGWIGAIVGMQFYLPALVRIPGVRYRMAFFEALVTLGVVAGAEALLIAVLPGLTASDAVLPAIALGAAAAVSTPTGVAVAAQRAGRRDAVVKQLELTTAVDALVAIVALGLLLAIKHPPQPGPFRPLTPTEWTVMTLGIGVVGGSLFHLFLGRERDVDRIFIALAGAVILTSGAAAYLQLSPLLTSLVFGSMLVNTSVTREEIQRALGRAERPVYFALLVFAGAAWQPSVMPWWLVPVLLFILARILVKVGGARLGAQLNGALPDLGPDWGRGLLGQGGLALAIALNYLQLPSAPYANVVFTAVIASVLLTDVASARLVQSVIGPLARRARPGR